MANINRQNISGLTPEKKQILKSCAGKASSNIDLNRVKEEWKYGNN